MNQKSVTSVNRWNSQNRKERYPLGIIIALLLAISLHVALFLILKQLNFFKSAQSEYETGYINVEQVTINEIPEVAPEKVETPEPDIAEVKSALTELDDVLAELKDVDLDIKADIKEPELSIQMSTPAKIGDESGFFDDILLSASSLTPLEEIGTGLANNSLADEGQIIIKEGSVTGEILDPNEILNNEALKGIGGLSKDGVMEGYSSLDDLMSMSTLNLQGARSALPSDLLFEYNSSELKSAAKFGLMKLGLLIDRNPKMFCILEGHTDTFGDDAYNMDLSIARAQAIKDYLSALEFNSEQIVVLGYGKNRPLVIKGSKEEQAPNRRVDILMRKEIPQSKQATEIETEPAKRRKASEVRKAPSELSPPPKVIEKPINRAVVVEESPTKQELEINRAIVIDEPEPKEPQVLKVKPMKDPNTIRRAVIVEEDIPRAIIVED